MTMPPDILASYEGADVDPVIRPLLEAAYLALTGPRPILSNVKASLEVVLLFLTSPHGKTHANCVATEHFFRSRGQWPVVWDSLPQSYVTVLDDIGSLLHDAIAAPEIAANFGSTPDLLLDRVRLLPR